MNPFESLSDSNSDQLQKYRRFFGQKKDGLLRTIKMEFGDAKADRLNEDMYSKEDVEDFCDYLASSVKNNVGAEVGTMINMSALAVSQLLESAQERGIELTLETAAIENQALLQAVEKMGLESLPKNPRRGVGELVSFKNDAKAVKEEMNGVEEKNRRLQEEVKNLTRKLSQIDHEKNYNASESKNNKEPIDTNQIEKIKSLEKSLENSKEENNLRVSDTAQFQQMRKLMQSQSGKIRDLKKKLERYEPDSGDGKDNDNDDF